MKESKSASARKTKAQLIEELEQVQILLSEKEELLEETRDMLSSAEQKSIASKDLNEQLEDTRLKLEEAEAFAEEMTDRAEQFEKEVEALQSQVNALQKRPSGADEIAALKEELEMSAKRQKELKEENANLESKLNELIEKQQALEAASVAEVETLESSKSKFLIEIYSRDGGFSGRIQHALTKDQRVFKGLDKEVIYNFIYAHRPQSEEAKVEIASVRETTLPEAPEATTKGSAGPRIRSFVVHAMDADRLDRVMPANFPLMAEMKLDLHEVEADRTNASLEYEIQIFAKKLGKRQKFLIATTKASTPWTDHLVEHVEDMVLPAGNYQFLAIAMFQTSAHSSSPMIAYHESGPVLIQ